MCLKDGVREGNKGVSNSPVEPVKTPIQKTRGGYHFSVKMGNSNASTAVYASNFGETRPADMGTNATVVKVSQNVMEQGMKDEGKPANKLEDKAKSKNSKDSTGPKRAPSTTKHDEKPATKSAKEDSKTAKNPPHDTKSRESKDHKSKGQTKPKKEKESRLVAEARKRSEQRASMPWKDHLSKKDQERLSSKEAIVHSSTSKFHAEMLKVHNLYRADHGAPSLKMSKELNKEAQERAEAFVACKSIDSTLFGENTYTTNFADSFKSVPSAFQVCSEWYEYAVHFNFGFQAKFPSKALKFMQVIWESEKEMGAGRATNGAGVTRVVALYRPKAEMPWNIQQNVKPPLVPLNPATLQHEHVPYKSEDQPNQPILTVKHRAA